MSTTPSNSALAAISVLSTINTHARPRTSVLSVVAASYNFFPEFPPPAPSTPYSRSATHVAPACKTASTTSAPRVDVASSTSTYAKNPGIRTSARFVCANRSRCCLSPVVVAFPLRRSRNALGAVDDRLARRWTTRTRASRTASRLRLSARAPPRRSRAPRASSRIASFVALVRSTTASSSPSPSSSGTTEAPSRAPRPSRDRGLASARAGGTRTRVKCRAKDGRRDKYPDGAPRDSYAS